MMMGASRYNFRAICHALSDIGAMALVADVPDIVSVATHWLEQPILQSDLGARAHAYACAQIGATQRHMDIVHTL